MQRSCTGGIRREEAEGTVLQSKFSNLQVFFKPVILFNNLFKSIIQEKIDFGRNADDVCRTNVPTEGKPFNIVKN